jgi:hypothetical protein
MPSAAKQIAMEISIRFSRDLDRLADDLVESVSDRTVWDSGDFQIIQETVTQGKQKANSRTAMGLDSAAWQGYQVGKVERFEASGEKFRWKLDPGANHCDDCLLRAAHGVLTMEDILTWCGIPANARTECNGGCRCDLEPA